MRGITVCREIERRGGAVVRDTRSHWRLVVRFGRGGLALVRVPRPWVPRDVAQSIERQLEPAFGEGWLQR